MQQLFAYGTLKPGNAPTEIADAVRSLRAVGRGQVRGRLLQMDGYPGAILDADGDEIKGVVLQIPNRATLKQLDLYEEYDPRNRKKSLFLRKKTRVALESGGHTECWIYEFNPRSKDK